MYRISKLSAGLAICSALSFAAPAYASELVIEDSFGDIGDVNTATGAVTNLHFVTGTNGQVLTDVAYTSNGNLYGTTLSNLYSLSPTLSNGTATLIGGAYSGSPLMNALTGNGTSLLGAGFGSTSIYTINPTTGVASVNSTYNSGGHASAGDLAFVGTTLYESALCGGIDCLVNANTGTVVGNFLLGGIFFTSDVFGLAYDGTTMWATDGTDIYSVNLANGTLTFDKDFGFQGLADSSGATTALSSTPIPGALPLFGGGIAVLGLIGRRRKRKSGAALI
jgi:hypothetical protein